MNYYLKKTNLLSIFSLSLAYILLGIISIKYVTMPSGIAIAWLPNALLLAFFLTTNTKEWKYYIPFFVLAEIIADYETFTILQSLQFSFINIFESMIGAFIIKKFSSEEKANFTSTKYVLIFFLVSLNLMPALSGLLGASIYHTQIDIKTSFFEFWRVWFLGNAVGILLLTPILVLLKENYTTLLNYKCNIQNIAFALLSIFLSFVIFSFNDTNFILPSTPLLFVLLLLWIVYKQDLLPGMIFAFFISVVAIYYTSLGVGPFIGFTQQGTTVYLQEFIALLLITTLFFGVLNKEINESKTKLEELNKTLEKKVEEKTQSLISANKKLKELASKDSLTNIYNRRMLDKLILKEIAQANRYGHKLSLIMVDIDHFKKVNDEFGHQVGDEVILSLVELISKNIRETDVFGRWGGEEFVILLTQTSMSQAISLAQNLKDIVQNHTFDQVGTKTLSLGISEYVQKEDPLLFIKRADDALYKAKSSGRNRVEFL